MIFKFPAAVLSTFMVATTPLSALEISALVGLASDSAAALEELTSGANSRTGESDVLQEVEFGITGSPTEELLLSYDFNAENYSDYSENSSSTHSVGARWNRDSGDWSYGLSADYLDMSLDGSAYLEMTMLTPSVSLFAGNNFFMASALIQNKGFEEFTEFDADLTQFSLLTIRFFNNYKSNLSVTLTTAEEDANNDTYDFDEDKIAFGLSHKFVIGSRKFRGRINYEVRSRDYPKVSDAAERSEENRDRIRSRLTTSISENTEIEFELDHKDRKANIASSTYDSQLFAIRLKYRR